MPQLIDFTVERDFVDVLNEVDKSLQDKGCKWPVCSCEVPDEAYSEYYRKEYCEAVNGR